MGIVSNLEVKIRVERLQSHKRNVEMCIGGGLEYFPFVGVVEEK